MEQRDVQQLIAELRLHFERTKEMAAFVSLKQSELRPDDEISFFGLLQAREQLAVQSSLLAGHSQLLNDEVVRMKQPLDPASLHLLKEVSAYARQLPL